MYYLFFSKNDTFSHFYPKTVNQHHLNLFIFKQNILSLLGNMDKQREQTKGRQISSDPCSKVTTSLQHELEIERERSEMWRKLYKDQAKEMKKKILDEGNNTQDVFGCMKLMLKNLSLPVNISMNFSKVIFINSIHTFLSAHKQSNQRFSV